jgi:hypothetical protein
MRVQFLAAPIAVAFLVSACRGSRTRDVAGDRRSPFASDGGIAELPAAPAPVHSAQARSRLRTFAKASARTLGTDAANLYYGDTENDGVFSAPKVGGSPTRLSRHAPVAGTIAIGEGSMFWVASPGDSVLKLPLEHADQPTTVREGGIFSDVATSGGDAFILEAMATGGILLRASAGTTTKITSFDGAPRAVVADETHTFVITRDAILRTSLTPGPAEALASGVALANPQHDTSSVFVLADDGGARVIKKVAKAGGAFITLARDVRDIPFEFEGDELLYLDATRPQVRAVAVGGGTSRVLIEDEKLTTAATLVADAKTVYVATGSRESGVIYSFEREVQRRGGVRP